MPPRTKKHHSLSEMSDEELSSLQDGFLDLRDHANYNIEAILREFQSRLEKKFDLVA